MNRHKNVAAPRTAKAMPTTLDPFPAPMTDQANHDDDRAAHGAAMRLATLIIGSIEIITFILFAHLMLQSTDLLGSAIGRGISALMALPLLGLVVPGLILASLNRAPKIALALVVAALPVAALLWLQA
jgi:hypothetical protein